MVKPFLPLFASLTLGIVANGAAVQTDPALSLQVYNADAGSFHVNAVLVSGKTDAQLWAMEGATIMNGIDDYPKKTEVTTLANAQSLVAFAQQHGMSALSMWAIQRDNAGCPGTGGANDCSGIAQSPWAFSAIVRPPAANGLRTIRLVIDRMPCAVTASAGTGCFSTA